MSLENAFYALILKQARDTTFVQVNTGTEITVKAAHSNYFRNINGPENTVAQGREYVVSIREFEDNNIVPVRGDNLLDSELEPSMIIEVREMIILGKIAGYRLRVQ